MKPFFKNLLFFVACILVFDSIRTFQSDNQHEILIISDIHMKTESVLKLLDWNRDNNKTKFDMILITGDFDNLTQYKKVADLPEYIESEKRIQILIELLKVFNCPVYIIPGNHDPYSMFDTEISGRVLRRFLQSGVVVGGFKIENMHKKKLYLSDRLVLIGHGGAVPAYDDPESTKNFKWAGFPYDNEIELEQDFLETKKLIEEETNKGNTIILMTHVGPKMSQTSVAYYNQDDIVYAGSSYMDSILKNYTSNILLFAHGHTHVGSGFKNFDSTTVLNAGSLGYYLKVAAVTLAQDPDKKWTIKRKEFINLE